MNRPLFLPQTPVGVQSNAREKQIFDLLRNLTITQVAGAFDQGFWTRDVMQATQSSPLIWHASLAFSAMHHKMKLGALPGDRRMTMAEDYYTIALRQYNKAIQHLIPLTSKKHMTYADKETVLLASVLFVGICCLQRNIKHAKLHIENAVELFYQWEFWQYEDSPGAVVRPRSLLQLVTTFQYQLSDMGGAKSAAVQRQIAMTQVTISPKPFTTVTEAYFEYLHLHFGRAMLHPDNDKGLYPMREKSMAYTACWNRWRDKFLALEKSQEGSKEGSPELDMEALHRLRLLVDCEDLCVSVRRNRTPETLIKSIPKMALFVDAAEEILERESMAGDIYQGSSPVFSFSLSICEVLRMIGLTTNSIHLRRRIVTILKELPRQDGFLDGQLSRFLIEAKMAFDKEHANTEVPEDFAQCNCVRGLFVCQTHKLADLILDFSEEEAVNMRILNTIHMAKGLPGKTYRFEWEPWIRPVRDNSESSG